MSSKPKVAEEENNQPQAKPRRFRFAGFACGATIAQTLKYKLILKENFGTKDG